MVVSQRSLRRERLTTDLGQVCDLRGGRLGEGGGGGGGGLGEDRDHCKYVKWEMGNGIMGKRGREREAEAYILKLRSRVERTSRNLCTP